MYTITCPICNEERVVSIWKNHWGGPPYVKLCTRCCKIGRKESAETRQKKSEALKGIKKPPEYSERLKQRHKIDPSLRNNLIPGRGAGWNKGETNDI